MFVKDGYTVTPGFTPIPLGAWIRITRSIGMVSEKGKVAKVVGYEVRDRVTREVTPITALHLDRGPLAFFRWPQCFPWEVEVVQERTITCDSCHGVGQYANRPCAWCQGTGTRTLE